METLNNVKHTYNYLVLMFQESRSIDRFISDNYNVVYSIDGDLLGYQHKTPDMSRGEVK
jgi:hypothetical protein